VKPKFSKNPKRNPYDVTQAVQPLFASVRKIKRDMTETNPFPRFDMEMSENKKNLLALPGNIRLQIAASSLDPQIIIFGVYLEVRRKRIKPNINAIRDQ
jgi:hypothetical protein